jgi:3-methylornithine--L-lysine ligase
VLAAIVGGSLQGIEVAYLAHKAGWDVLLIDKKKDVPAVGLSDRFIQSDITRPGVLDTLPEEVGIIIPATENTAALEALYTWSMTASVPVAFDGQSYTVSSSKLESDRLFSRLNIPAPRHWPECDFPIIAKPSTGSGSKAVQYIRDRREFEKRFPEGRPVGDWVLQEYLSGPSYSLEVIGTPGNYNTFQVTGLEMDAGFDCKRVNAPAKLSTELIQQMEAISLRIANALRLKGIMDVEAILTGGTLNVLEIDARFPSQTPTVVYHSTGVNLLERLAGVYLGIEPPSIPEAAVNSYVIYEHIAVTKDCIETGGEHMMKGKHVGRLKLHKNFFGAQEAITDYRPHQERWVATLIIVGKERDDTAAKRNETISNIQAHMNLGNHSYRDPVPMENLQTSPEIASKGLPIDEKSDERESYYDTT